MARVTVEDCLSKVETRFQLVLISAKRARQLSNGAEAHLPWENDKPTVMALREIAEGFIDASILDDDTRHEQAAEAAFEITEARMQEVVAELSLAMPAETSEEVDKPDISDTPEETPEE